MESFFWWTQSRAEQVFRRGHLGALVVFVLLVASSCAHHSQKTAHSSLGSSSSEVRQVPLYFDSVLYPRPIQFGRDPSSLGIPSEAPRFDQALDAVTMQAQADYHFAVAESYSQSGLIPQAVESFRAALVFDPKSLEIRLRLAQELIQSGNYTQALQLIESEIKANPNHYRLHLALGSVYSAIRNYPKAIEVYQRAKKLNPQAHEPLLYLGALHAEMGQFEKALIQFKELAKNADWDKPHLAYFYQGRIYHDKKDQDLAAAERAFNEAIRLQPSHLDSVMSLASLWVKAGRKKQAEELLAKWNSDHGPNSKVSDVLVSIYMADENYEAALAQLRILELDPEYQVEARNQMAQIHFEKKQYTELASVLKKIVTDIPDADRTWYLLGVTLAQLERTSEAIAAFQSVPPGTTHYVDSVSHVAHLLKDQNKVDAALSYLESEISKQPEEELFVVYGSLASDRRAKVSGLPLMKKAAELFPKNPNILFFNGILRDKSGDKEGLISEMKKVIELDPEHVQALNYLAYTYAELDRELDTALQLAERALALSPRDGYVLDTYGWLLYKKGRYPEAIRHLEQAFDLKPKEPLLAEHLGDAYAQMQMFDQARKMYEYALSLSEDQAQVKVVQTKLTNLQKLVQRPIPQEPIESAPSAVPTPSRIPASQ